MSNGIFELLTIFPRMIQANKVFPQKNVAKLSPNTVKEMMCNFGIFILAFQEQEIERLIISFNRRFLLIAESIGPVHILCFFACLCKQ